VKRVNKFRILLPSPSSDLGKKSATSSKEHDLNRTRNLPFIFPTIPNQSSAKVLDSFNRFQLHLKFWLPLFQFNIRMLNVDIAIELVTRRINAMTYILVRIVARRIIQRRNVPRGRNLQDWKFTMSGSIFRNGQ
jgi:hypothetical protein